MRGHARRGGPPWPPGPPGAGRHRAILLAVLLGVGACATPRAAVPRAAHALHGVASWYGPEAHGRRTASGVRYNMFGFTAAHPSLPLGTRVRVRSLATGKSVVVTITDRGPFREGRLIDLSYIAARQLGIVGAGLAEVELEVL